MRKTIIALLSIIMCVTLLAACGTSTATVDNGDKKKSTRKVYKVHKYKKSATSKAARSAQGKGKRRK